MTQVQLRGHAGGKALRWLELPATHVNIRPRSSSGGTGGYDAGLSAAYENQALEANTDFVGRSYLENVPKKKPALVVVHVIYQRTDNERKLPDKLNPVRRK